MKKISCINQLIRFLDQYSEITNYSQAFEVKNEDFFASIHATAKQEQCPDFTLAYNLLRERALQFYYDQDEIYAKIVWVNAQENIANPLFTDTRQR